MHLKFSLVTVYLRVGILRQDCHLLSIIRHGYLSEHHGYFKANAPSGTIVDKHILC